MFSKPKGWLSGGLWKPKNPHSLEHLKYLYGLLCKNQIVTENNSHLLVETLRSISEILIWGDQNDSTVFDFFLEKNMLSFFLRFMRQKCGRYICVQLLQTLNILFENISNETSVYYLLSNNHINSIIVHKFDFSDEEVMAYYISFLKTLSLKLNKHTIHFFYNEHTNDFALYTEAIKFFNHSESMVRIAVRTITLNVYKACRINSKLDEQGQPKVDDRSMLRYIRDKTAAPYFSNLVWFIGNHIIDLDACVRNDADHNSRDRLADLVAEHLDHLHYLNDIVCLGIDALNGVLTDHLLNRLLIPLYVYSLTKRRKYTASTDERPHVSSVVSLFLLSQVFLIISHCPLVRQLADIIFNGDMDVCADPKDHSPKTGRKLRGFVKPVESLAQTLDNSKGPTKPRRKRPNYRNSDGATSTEAVGEDQIDEEQVGEDEQKEEDLEETRKEEQTDGAANAEEEKVAEGEVNSCTSSPVLPAKEVTSPNQNSTDEEKLASIVECSQADFSLTNRPYLEALFNALECSDNDYEALFALCLLYAMGHNTGIHQELLDTVFMPTDKSEAKDHYNITLVEKLIKIISLTCQNNSKVRLATMEMSIVLMKQLVYQDATRACYLQDRHLAALEGAREEGALLLRNFYKVWEKSEEIFLDMFEDEYREMKNRPLNVEYLMMDASILLPPTGTPLTGIDFNKRLPCGEVERARRAIRVFFMLRDLSLTLRQEPEAQLPLTKNEECVKVNDVLDLNNSDLIACTVITKDSSTGSNKKERRFLVIDVLQLILVEPDTRRLGWGVVKFVGFLQDVEVTGDKDDSRSLHITIHKPSMNVHARPLPLLSARFVFDDHIRCMAAKQRLTKGRLRARQRKMQMIARLLELPTNVVDSMYQPPAYTQSAAALRTAQSSATAIPGRSHPVRMHPRLDQGVQRPQSEAVQKSVFASVSHLHAFHSAREKDQHRSKPIAIRGGQSSRVRREAQHVASGAVPDSSGSSRRHQGSPEVEQAEEATPSPEAHAFQSLNPPQAAVQEPKSGRQSRNGSTERTDPMEIPLEDMSKKNRGSAAAELLSKQGDSQSHSRSTSYSPRRRRNSPSGSPRLKGSPISSLERSRPESRTETRKRAGSHPSPRTSRIPVGEARGRSSNVSNTSFTVQPKSECESDAAKAKTGSTSQSVTVDQVERKKGQEVVQRRRRSSSGTGPKTLTPAPEPAVSLIISSDVQAATCQDSPKLRPPAELERIRSLSDASSTDTEPKMSSSKEAKVGVADEPKPDCLEDVEQSGKHTDSKVNVEIAESLKSSQVSNSDRLDTDNPPVCATTTQTTSRSNDTRIESINKPPFRLSKETEPTTVINNTGADLSSLDRSSPVEERAMQQLSKIAQKARQVYTLKQEAGSIELTHQEAAPVQEPSEEQTENCESTITSDSTVTANKKKEETEAEEETRATEEKTRLEVATEDNVKTELVDLEDQPESQELSTSECKDVIEESKNCETTDKTEKS